MCIRDRSRTGESPEADLLFGIVFIHTCNMKARQKTIEESVVVDSKELTFEYIVELCH